MSFEHATAARADYGETTGSEALAEARRRRALPGYRSGDAIRRKLSEPITLEQADPKQRARLAGIPECFWGLELVSVQRRDQESYRAWKRRAGMACGFCVPAGFDHAFGWASAWEPSREPGMSTWLSGAVGVGKSALAAAMAQRLLSIPVVLQYEHEDGQIVGLRREGGIPVLWTSETSLMRDEKAGSKYGKKGESMARRAVEVEVLIVDDFLSTEAKGYKKDDMIDLWEWVIGERYYSRKPVIFTSNSNHERVVDRYGLRLADRVAEMISHYSVVIDGDSWRSV